MKNTELSGSVIGAAIRVHTQLGPGLLESAYVHCLAYELIKNGFDVKIQMPVPLVYNSVKLECGYRCDIMVENSLVVEVKSVEVLNNIHLAQVLTYLRLTNTDLGLLINFNVLRLKDGIRRVINDR